MAKGWTRQEFDGAFALEDLGPPKILPVWLDVDKAAVTEYSPILAARLAIAAVKDPDETAKTIAIHFEKILQLNPSWGQKVRIDTKCLPWLASPSFNDKSLKILDEYSPYFFSRHRPPEDLPGFSDALSLNVGETISDTTRLNGRCVTIMAVKPDFKFMIVQ